MNEIETYKTLTIALRLEDNKNSFSRDINIEFIPDEIILKNMNWCNAQATNEIPYKLITNLIDGDGVIGTLPKITVTTSFHDSYNIPFRNSRPINGTYLFEIKDYTNAPISVSTENRFLSFTLVFIKWKKK